MSTTFEFSKPNACAFRLMNPNGTYLELKWDGEKLVTSGDAILDEAARTFVDYVIQCFDATSTERISELERLKNEVERLRAELVIGSFILRPHDADHVWIGRPDGEGGAFAISKVEAALRAFYRENF